MYALRSQNRHCSQHESQIISRPGRTGPGSSIRLRTRLTHEVYLLFRALPEIAASRPLSRGHCCMPDLETDFVVTC